MKILFVVDFSIAGDSGKNKATREKISALSNLVGEDNIEIIYPKYSNSYLSKIVGRLMLDIKVGFKVLFKKGEFIIIQRAIFLPLMLLFCKLRSVKVYAEFHADFKEEIKFLNKNKLEKVVLHLLAIFYNLNYKLVDGIIFNHPNLKTKFDLLFKKPSIYSYNGANYKDFYPIQKLQSRLNVSIPPDRFVFLFLGSVSKWHGVDLLINVFNQSSFLENPNAFLYIVGMKKNVYTDGLISMAKNKNIIFIESVDTHKASYYINASDVCLLPVKHIRTSPGSPLKLYDYISCGKPIITQQELPGYSDEVVRHRLGFVTDFNNPILASKQLERYMDFDLSSFKKNNRDVAVNVVSWKNRMEAWLEFIDKNK